MDFIAQKTEIDLELRSLQEKVRSGSVSAEDGKKALAELRAKKDEITKAEALASAPIEKRSGIVSLADIRDAMLEKRNITLNGTGASAQLSEIVKLISQKTPLLGLVRYFYGPNSSTKIPLLAPSLAVPVSQSEGYTTGSTDETAAISLVSVDPVAYNSILPITFEALNLSMANFEGQLPALFADAYAKVLHKNIVDALFTPVTGVAAATTFECAAAGLPTIMDIANLADEMADYMDNAVLVTSVAAKQFAIGGASDSAAAKIFAEEWIRNGTVNGVKVITTGYAPKSTTAGALVVVGGNMDNMGVGIAAELTIQPKTKVGSNITFYDSFMYMGNKCICPSNLMALKAKASG